MFEKIKHLIIGKPRDPEDPHVFHKMSLVAFMAWIGLGADGLSSSAYGPDEAFRALGSHRELAIFLAIATALTVFIISFAYSRIIEHFPTGGGGYVVATKLLGAPAGVVSGSALLIDYVLTITVSIASGADAIFAFLPDRYLWAKLPIEYGAIAMLIVMNLRGVKESITVLMPIFFLFLITHAVLLMTAFFQHYTEIPIIASDVSTRLQHSLHDPKLGFIAMFLIFAKAYAKGAGTFTGIEAVSNGLGIMRDPKVETGKRTMVYMATSLAITAGGILAAYLLVGVTVPTGNPKVAVYSLAALKGGEIKCKKCVELKKVEESDDAAVSQREELEKERRVRKGQDLAAGNGWALAAEDDGTIVSVDDDKIVVAYDPPEKSKPMNAVLLEKMVEKSSFFGKWFVVVTLIAEAALLLIAAQTGFIDGPRVMANMALDSWLPHRFSSLSERLTTHYGVLLIGGAALAALWYTGGSVDTLVTMYSINVFITFSLTELGMCKFYITHRHKHKEWKHALPIHMTGLFLCSSILTLVVIEKFTEGAWMTIVVTSILIFFCFLIRRYYRSVYAKLGMLPVDLERAEKESPAEAPPTKLDLTQPTAVLLVGGYGGLGIHSLMEIRRDFPNYFKQFIFVSVSVIDSGNFKGAEEIERLKKQTQDSLDKYAALARKLGYAATTMTTIATEPVEGAAELCTEVALRYKKAMFFAGKLVFQRETWYQRLMHNETAIAIQNRMQWLGYPMLILPVRIWGGKAPNNADLPKSLMPDFVE